MDLEVVTIGAELLLGFTVDSNAAEIAHALASVGANVSRCSTVADDAAMIRSAVAEGLSRSGFVISTGGLGPTRDDVTKNAVAAIFDAPLELDVALLERLEQRFEALGRGPMPPINRNQALVPRGAIVLPNPSGTAPGLWLDGPAGTVVLLPGVPSEMRWLLVHEVVPRCRDRVLRSDGAVAVTRSRTLRTTGVTESQLATDIAEVEQRLAPATLAYLPSLEGVDLRLTVRRLSAEQADSALDRAADTLRPALRAHFYGEEQTDLASVLVDVLRLAGVRLSVAESCTGGLLGARITTVPGASEVFAGGVIAYSNASKVRDLGVPEPLLERNGAVSETVAEAMALGVSRRFGSEVGIAITGIAGPTGGSAEKPVGTVCLAAVERRRRRAVTRQFPGDRWAVRARSAQAGLDLARRLLSQDEAPAAVDR